MEKIMNKYIKKASVLLASVGAFLFLLGAVGSENQALDDKEVVLKEGNVVVFRGEVTEETVGLAIQSLREADKVLSEQGIIKENFAKKQPIYLILDTPGGSVMAGLELIDFARGLGRPVHTVTMFAASMGFQIVQHLDTRYMTHSGTLMSHRARGGVSGEFGGQSESQLDSRLNFWKEKIQEMDLQTVARTGGKQTLESYTKSYVPELWLTSGKAVSGGYADKVVTVRCDKSLVGTTQHQAFLMGVIPVTYDLDKCPLNPTPMNVKIGVSTNKGYMSSEDFIKKGGIFGEACLVSQDPLKLCALDTTLNVKKIETLKKQFVSEYKTETRKVIDYKLYQ